MTAVFQLNTKNDFPLPEMNDKHKQHSECVDVISTQFFTKRNIECERENSHIIYVIFIHTKDDHD